MPSRNGGASSAKGFFGTKAISVFASKIRQWVEPPYWKKPISSPLPTLSPTATENTQDEISAMPTNTQATLPRPFTPVSMTRTARAATAVM